MHIKYFKLKYTESTDLTHNKLERRVMKLKVAYFLIGNTFVQ